MFSCTFAAYFQNTFSLDHLGRDASEQNSDMNCAANDQPYLDRFHVSYTYGFSIQK